MSASKKISRWSQTAQNSCEKIKHQRKSRILGSFNNHGWSFTGRLSKPAFAGAKQQKTRPRGKKWLLLFGSSSDRTERNESPSAQLTTSINSKFLVRAPRTLLAWRAWKEKSRKYSQQTFFIFRAREERFQFCEKKELTRARSGCGSMLIKRLRLVFKLSLKLLVYFLGDFGKWKSDRQPDYRPFIMMQFLLRLLRFLFALFTKWFSESIDVYVH